MITPTYRCAAQNGGPGWITLRSTLPVIAASRFSWFMVLLACLLTGSLSCVADASSTSSSVDPYFAQALRFAPSVSPSAPYEIDFTDWTRIKSKSAFRLSADPTIAQEEAFLTKVSDAGMQELQMPTTLFPLSVLRWEATIYSEEAPLVDVAGFQQGFDLSHISDRLKSCGFGSGSASRFVIYAGSIAQVFKCSGTSGIGLLGLNSVYAVDTEDQVVVSSTSLSAVRATIAGSGLSVDSRPLADVLAPLSADPAVTIDLGASYCRQLTRALTRHLTAVRQHLVLREDPSGGPYMAFALGYRVLQQPPTAQIVMDYGNSRTASAQLSLREHLLETDYSVESDSPYSKSILLESASAEGRNVVLTVEPASGNHLALGAMADNSDLAFARC